MSTDNYARQLAYKLGGGGGGVSLLTTANTWILAQTFSVAPVFTDPAGSRAALGLGSAAPLNTGTSGGNIPLCNGANTWAAAQTFSVAPVFSDAPGTRTALGLGTAATQNTGTSGATVPFLNGVNTWASAQTFSGGLSGTLTGNAATATKWAASINLTLTGAVTGVAAIDGSGNVSLATSGASGRTLLGADKTYYVRTDGSDSNDGSANTAGSAFLTIQKAVDTAASIDFNSHVVTIQVADGTYAGQIVVPPMVGQKDGNGLVIQGNTATPANVILSYAGGTLNTVTVNAGAACLFKGFKFNGGSTAGSMSINVRGLINIANLEFGVAQYHLVAAQSGGNITAVGNYTISGGAVAHMLVDVGGYISINSKTITLTGTPAFTNFAYAQRLGGMLLAGNTYSGAATGIRYSANSNSVIDSNGGGATYLPGGTAGATATGGQYI